MSIRIGIVDFDSSHCIEFARRINQVEIGSDQWVDGGRVVAGCPGTSLLSPERLPGFTAEMERLGISLFEKPAGMINQIDAVMILSVDGSVHWERAKEFIEAGIICFVDKPFTCSVAEAEAMVQLAEQKGVPIFSSSALRYAPELDPLEGGDNGEWSTGPIVGAVTYGPAPTRLRNPGLFHYGIHATEVLFTLLGPDCRRVACVREGGEAGSEESGADVVTGSWSGGRLGSVRGIRSGARSFGLVAFGENGVRHVAISVEYVYRELLKRVIQFFETRVSPVDPQETLRIVRFIESARASGERGGAPVDLYP